MDKQEFLNKSKGKGIWVSLYEMSERVELLAANLKELNDFLLGDGLKLGDEE